MDKAPGSRQYVFWLRLLALLLTAFVSATAGTIVLPSGFGSTEGDLGQNTAVRDLPRTLQIVFASSQLAGLPAGSVFTGLTFRLEGGLATWPAAARTWTSYDIVFSTSLAPPGSLSTTFAGNIAGDAVTVRSGALTIPAGSFPGGGSPNAFGYLIPFSTPFAYTGGDLLITIRHTGNGVDTQFLDSDTPALATLYQSISADAYAASAANLGLSSTAIIQLEYAAIPEPGTLGLLGAGLIVLALALLRRGPA